MNSTHLWSELRNARDEPAVEARPDVCPVYEAA